MSKRKLYAVWGTDKAYRYKWQANVVRAWVDFKHFGKVNTVVLLALLAALICLYGYMTAAEAHGYSYNEVANEQAEQEFCLKMVSAGVWPAEQCK